MENRVIVRHQIVQLHNEGYSNRHIGRRLNISPTTVALWVNRQQNGEFNNGIDNPRDGRPVELSPNDRRRLARTSRENPFLTARQLKLDLDFDVSVRSVRRCLVQENLHGRIAAKKEKLSPANIEGRYNFANDHLEWQLEDWENVVFTDEKVFVVGHNGQIWVRRPVGSRFEQSYIKQVQRSGRFTVNVHGWMSAVNSGELIRVDGQRYSEMVENTIIPSVLNRFLDGNFKFMHDRSPIHMSRVAMANLNRLQVIHGFQIIDWPSKGADMNPIENVWAEMVKIVDHTNVRNQDQLWTAVSNAWNQLKANESLWRNLHESMPRRMQIVHENRGYWSKY